MALPENGNSSHGGANSRLQTGVERNAMSNEEEYVFVVSYGDDKERKRIEYLFNNWNGEIKKPEGLVQVAGEIDHDESYERIFSKVPPEQVSSYRLEPVDAEVDPESVIVEESLSAAIDDAEGFIEYMLFKKKPVLQSAERNEYEVDTKKGRADVTYQLTGQDEKVNVQIRVEGYSPAPEFLASFFETELTDYAESQST